MARAKVQSASSKGTPPCSSSTRCMVWSITSFTRLFDTAEKTLKPTSVPVIMAAPRATSLTRSTSSSMATRYDRTAETFFGYIDITSIRLWLLHLST